MARVATTFVESFFETPPFARVATTFIESFWFEGPPPPETPTEIRTAVAPTANPSGVADPDLITTWRSGAPDAGRAWNQIGRGGVVTDRELVVTASSPHGYESVLPWADPSGRMEAQVAFQGRTSAPLWASGASGHVLALDDGERTLGVSIGDVLQLVHPWTGAVVYTPETQPGGWTTRRVYHLVKVDTTWWELMVDGVLVARVPYAVAPSSTYGVAARVYGWLDATPGSTGEGVWSDLEVGHDSVLAPRWQVDRARTTMPGPVRDAWTDSHEALLRATVGTFAEVADRQQRAALQMTAAFVALQTEELAETLPADAGWVDTGTAPTLVRDRIRYVASAGAAAFSEFTFDPVPSGDAPVIRAGATFRVVSQTPAAGRGGPFLRVSDGTTTVALESIGTAGQRAALTAGAVTGAVVQLGDVALPLPVDHPFRLELVVSGTWVLAFVDGELVEEIEVEWTGAGPFVVGLGSAEADCTVDVEGVSAVLGLAATRERPGLVRRAAERLVFAGGCETPARLEAWLRARMGVLRARGTDRMRSEIRRLTCSDYAAHEQRVPATWYLGVTYPEITPVFLTDRGSVTTDTIEVEAQAPNLPMSDLLPLLSRYLLPRSTRETVHRAVASSVLTSSVVTGATSVFSVADASWLEAGDEVTLRRVDTGTVVELEYDATPATAADTMAVAVDAAGAFRADWTATTPGWMHEIGGEVALAGLDGDRTAAITPGNRVKVRGATAAASGWAEVIGELGGVAVTERLAIDGTSETLGTQTWDTVHGVVVHPVADGAIEVLDQTGAVLYTVADGSQAAGVHVFDPPATADGTALSSVADAATTNPIVVGLVEAGGGHAPELVTLTGTTPVVLATTPALVRWVAAGYLAAARTVTLTGAAIHDRTTPSASIVSSSAGDTQRWVVVAVDSSGAALLVEGELDGTTPVSVALPAVYRVVGVALYSVAVGTVSLSLGRSSGVASIAPGDLVAGIKLYRIESSGEPITVELDATPTIPRYAVVVSIDPDRTLHAEAVRLSTDATPTEAGVRELRALAVGHVPAARSVTVAGVAWRGRTWEEVSRAIAASYAWTLATAPAASVFDAVADPTLPVDVTAGATFAGRWSVLETAAVVAVVEDEVETTALTEVFGVGDRIRGT